MTARPLIYQVAVGDVNPLYEACIQSVARYCARWHIDHWVQREPLLRITPVNNQRSEGAMRLGYLPIYEKENAFEHLPERPAVCIVDSDIYIRDGAPNIFAVPGSAPFAGVLEHSMPLTSRHAAKLRKYSQAQYGPLRDQADFLWTQSGASFYNMGLMLLRPTLLPYLAGLSPRQWLQQPRFERFVNGEGAWRWSTDQTLLNYWLRSDGIACQDLDWRWNALYGAVPQQHIHQGWFIHFFLAQQHVGDQSVERIIGEMAPSAPV